MLIVEINNQESINSMQSDINAISVWCNKWLMQLNEEKCKVVHVGKNNPKFNYVITNSNNEAVTLEKCECERDLGIMLSADLKWQTHIEGVAAK